MPPIQLPEGITFDDILLVPSYSTIKSRGEVSIAGFLAPNYPISVPIISANMDTVTGYSMMQEMYKVGAAGILHRFMSIEEMKLIIEKLDVSILTVSVGVGDKAKKRVDAALETGKVNGICVDVAHGDHSQVIEIVKYITRQDVPIRIAGNIATPEAADRLCSSGANVLKVGIGPGSLCTTRVVTGFGVPQLTAISEVRTLVDSSNYHATIIGDGGIRNSGDIVKALAFGADTVMIGSLLAGTIESPGQIFEGRKIYRGMASRSAQEDWKKDKKVRHIEGETKTVSLKGSVEEVINSLAAGIRSGFSYAGAKHMKDLRSVKYRRVSHSSLAESRPHGLNNTE